jgi:hypothetical protein
MEKECNAHTVCCAATGFEFGRKKWLFPPVRTEGWAESGKIAKIDPAEPNCIFTTAASVKSLIGHDQRLNRVGSTALVPPVYIDFSHW